MDVVGVVCGVSVARYDHFDQLSIYRRIRNIILSYLLIDVFFFSSRRRHTRWPRDWSSDVCSSDENGEEIATNMEYFSVGGGFVLSRAELDAQLQATHEVPAGMAAAQNNDNAIPYDFSTGDQLLELCDEHGMTIWEIVAANEAVIHREDGGLAKVNAHLDLVWDVMRECVTDGIATKGILPGGLQVNRRAPQLYSQLLEHQDDPASGFSAMEWVNLYTLAVNEPNAAGGRRSEEHT